MLLTNFLKQHPEKTHIIFDFDETIFRLLLPWDKCWEGIEKQLHELDRELITGYRDGSISWAKMQNSYIKKHKENAWNLIYKNNVEFEMGFLMGVEVFDELKDFIKANTTLTLYIWSSNTEEVISRVLKEYKIEQKFKKILSRTTLKMLKPDIEGFDRIYNSKIQKQNYLFVGDSIYDQQVAIKSGIDFYRIDFFNPIS